MDTLQTDTVEPLARKGHEETNKWLRENHHLPYPEWEALIETDKEVRRQRVLLILNGVQSELNEEEKAFSDAVKEQAKQWHLL